MSLAPLDRADFAPASVPSASAPSESTTEPRRLRAVPPGTEARGFVLYVGIDDAKAEAGGT